MPERQFEPMTVGQILDQTFRLYKRNFLRFVAIVAVVQVPLALISMLLLVPVATNAGFQQQQAGIPGSAEWMVSDDYGQAGNTVSDPDLPFGAIFLGGFVAGLIWWLAATLSNAALIKSVSESYLGREATVGEAYRFVLPKLWRLLWAGIMVAVIVSIGFLLLIVPGVIFAIYFALTTQAIVVEDVSAKGGMSRSKELASGNKGKVCGLLVLVTIIGAIIGWIFGAAGEALGFLLPAQSEMTAMVISQSSSLIGQVLAAPIGAAAMILLYYDLRIRKEGFDLEMLAKSLGSSPTATVSNASEL